MIAAPGVCPQPAFRSGRGKLYLTADVAAQLPRVLVLVDTIDDVEFATFSATC